MMPRLVPFCLLALILALGLPQSASAGEGAVCLQDQLAALGFDPGTPDGKIGPATRRALAEYEAANTALAARPLDQVSAIVFCRQLGLRDADLARYWPASPRVLRVEGAGARDDDLRGAMLREALKAIGIVQQQLGVKLAAPVSIVVGSNAKEIAAVAKDFTEASPGAVDRFAKRTCDAARDNGGIRADALPGVILFCHRPDQVFNDWFIDVDFRKQLGGLVVMQAINQLTGDLGTGTDAEYYRANGPMWLMVGTMQLVQREVDGNVTELGRIKSAERLRAEGLPHPERMETYQSNLEDPELLGKTGLLVTYDLTLESGLAPVGKFYQELGLGVPVDDAFMIAFGQSMKDFYQRYP